MDEHIYFVGLPGAGKTHIGSLLAEQLDLPFCDLDARLVAAFGMPISDYFARYGEAAFRDAEQEMLASAAAEPFQVVSTGGGIVLRAENRRLMRQTGRVVFLERSMQGILASLSGDSRPLLRGDAEARLADLSCRRRPLYEACAHLRVGNDGEPRETLNRLLDLFGSL